MLQVVFNVNDGCQFKQIKKMSRFNKMQVIEAMRKTGMVPVFFNGDVEIVKNVVKACYDGGVRVFS